MTGAEILFKALLLEGVDHIFGYAGATICPLVDVLKEIPEIGYTLVRTEQNAGHMASGYARTTGKVGVCLVTSGPGATNLLTGIATAYMDSIPMVAITGQVPTNLLGKDIFQEVGVTSSVAAFSKHSYLVKNAANLPRVIKDAFYIASTGRPGPVLIDVPSDVQTQEVENPIFPEQAFIRGYHPTICGDTEQIDAAAQALSAAKRPVLCIGGGVFLSHAEREIRQLAERLQVPVVTTMMGLSALPTGHPLNIGMIGSQGNDAANKALAESDLLVMLGARAADRSILSPQEIQSREPSVHIDIDPAEIGKNLQPKIPLVGDIKTVLGQIMQKEIVTDCADWLSILQESRAAELVMPLKTEAGFVSPGHLFRKLGHKLSADSTVCVDVGQNQLWACKHLWLDGTRLLTSGGLGTMGYALPCAVGVKVAAPDRQTIVICGDGSFQMAMNELAAVSLNQYDIKLILIQNGVLGLVNQTQKTAPYHGPFGVSLDGSPDYAKIAEAYGIPCIDLTEEAEIDSALDQLFAVPGPALLRVRVSPDFTTTD